MIKATSTLATNLPVIRNARDKDVSAIHELELKSFTSDRLSLRRIKHWVRATNKVFLVAEDDGQIVGYGLVLLLKGTRLARLYSIAVDVKMKGRGVGKLLLIKLEEETVEKKRLFMRLEVAHDNASAIKLYESLGYITFDCINDYYEDHKDALRMQKRIRYPGKSILQHPMPWYRQTTEFTCGPASMLMAMASLRKGFSITQGDELDIWREATTIFMTSGHGGCHPIGLGLAAKQRKFKAEVYINNRGSLFVESVRNAKKKKILSVVNQQFLEKSEVAGVPVHFQDITQDMIVEFIDSRAAVVMLISTYRIDGKKAPHWVAVSGYDDECFYLHDPDPIEDNVMDAQYTPIARKDFAKMSMFGSSKLRTCIVIRK